MIIRTHIIKTHQYVLKIETKKFLLIKTMEFECVCMHVFDRG